MVIHLCLVLLVICFLNNFKDVGIGRLLILLLECLFICLSTQKQHNSCKVLVFEAQNLSVETNDILLAKAIGNRSSCIHIS
jgi:uncharacterized membrane protein YczE